MVTALGGPVDFRVYDRLVITIPAAAIEGIRHLPGTKYVQRAIIGAQPTAVSAPARVEALHPVTTSGPPTWSSGNYAYDGAGNITSIGTDSFIYDQLSRLTTANVQGHAESYVYDPFGNMTSRTTDNVSWPLPIDSPSPTNRFTSPAATYDAAGSLTDYASQHYVYDPFGMMREKDYDYTGQDSYVYNAEDERIGTKSGDWWEWSFRDSSGKVIREFESHYLSPTMQWLWVEDYVSRRAALGGRSGGRGGRTAALPPGSSGDAAADHGVGWAADQRARLLSVRQRDQLHRAGDERGP